MTSKHTPKPITAKEAATLRRLDSKIGAGNATRRDVDRAIELKRKPGAAAALLKGATV